MVCLEVSGSLQRLKADADNTRLFISNLVPSMWGDDVSILDALAELGMNL